MAELKELEEERAAERATQLARLRMKETANKISHASKREDTVRNLANELSESIEDD